MTAICLFTLQLCSPAAATSMARDVSLQDSYFDDAVFVGDSISLKLKNYVNKQRNRTPGFFGNAQFLTVGGLGSGNVQLPVGPGTLHPAYNGEKMLLEDSVAATGAKKMYIMFGMNDIVPYGVDGAIENLETLIDKILEKSPGLSVAVENVTPILTDKQQRNLNNSSISEYNQALEDMCGRRGFEYLDIASQLADSDGGLVYEYCGDAQGLGMHLSDAGCLPWIDYLRSHPVTDVDEDDADQSEDWEDDPFDQESVETFVDYDPDEEEVLILEEDEEEAPENQNEGLEVISGDPVDIYKEFALDVTNASKVKKPWKPKLKGRLLN